MNTIFVLVEPETSPLKAARVYHGLDAEGAVRWFKNIGACGAIYAARCSDTVAAEIRKLTDTGRGLDAGKLLKLYSHSLQHVGDVT